MDNLESFIQKFGGLTEEYVFYNGEVTLRYDPKDHVYLLVTPDGTLEKVLGVTSVSHIIDKSMILIPWACKMMQQKLVPAIVAAATPVEGTTAIQIDYPVLETIIADSKRAHKEKLNEAGDIGSIAHAWIEQYINCKLNDDLLKYNELLQAFPQDERAKNACLAALDWMHYHNVRWIHTERKIYSRKHKYAGTMDGLCLVDSCKDPLCCPHPFKDRLSIADWKTSNYLYPEYLLQTAAYEAAYVEETHQKVEDRWIIRLGKEDAKFEPWHLEAETFKDDFDAFLAALNLRLKFDIIEERISNIKDLSKQKKKQDKVKSLLQKCKKADTYKGIRKPNCNKGNPCEYCLAKYKEVQDAKAGIKVKVQATKNAGKRKRLTPKQILESLSKIAKTS